MNLFDFTAESSERKATLNPFGSYLEKNTDRFVKGAKENIPAPRAKNVKRSEPVTEEIDSKPKPSLKELLAKRYGTKTEEEVSEGVTGDDVTASYSKTEVQTPQSEVKTDTSFSSAMGRSAKDLAQSFWAVGAQIPRIGANIASLPIDIVGGRYFGEEVPAAQELAKNIREGGEVLTSKAGDFIGLDEDRKKIAEVTTDIAASFALPGWQIGKVWSVWEAIRGANMAKNVVADVVLKLAPIATKWVIDAAKYSAVSEGRLPTVWEAVVWAAITPVANMAKSLPWIRGITGKSEILNAGSVRPGTVTGKPTALYDKAGKLLGTEAQLQTSASRLYGATWDAYDVNNAISVARKFSPEEISALKNSQNPARDAAYLADAKQKGLYEIAKDVTKANTTPIPVESLWREVAWKVRNPVKEGISLLKWKERELVDEDLKALSAIENKVNSNSPLTLQEIHEFSVLMGKYSGNFYDGFAKDAGYELTRKGVKDLVYKFGWKELWKIDDEISSLIDARTNWRKIDEAVTATKSKYGNGVALEVAKFFSNLILTGGNITKAAVRTWVGSGQAKVSAFDAVDFSSQLGKNLKKINELTKGLEKSRTEEEALELIKRLKSQPIQETVPTIKKPSNTNLSDPIKEAEDFAKAKKLDEEIAKYVKEKENIAKPKNATLAPVEIRSWVYREPKKWEVIKKPSHTVEVNRKIVWLTEKGGVKNIIPSNQIKLNQWTYKPVRVILSDKDKEIMEYVSFNHRTLSKDNPSKSELSKLDSMWKSLENKWVKESEVFRRASFIKEEAKKVRSKDSETILDLLRTEDKPSLKKNIPKPKK